MKDNSGNNDLVIERVVQIAGALDGKTEQESEHTGDRLRDALGRIAAQVEQGGGGSSLPAVTSADNGKVLTVEDGAWAATKSVYIIESSGNTSPLNGSEISTLAESGILPVLYYSNSYWIYSMNNGSTAYFVKYLYSPFSQKYDVRYAFVNSSKGINEGLSKNVYMLPSTGIPETDLAQAVKDKLNKFVVTLTPTSPDYSGTMDKTVAEINAAYEAGQQIVFRVMMSATEHMDVDCTASYFSSGFTYPSFNAYIVGDSGVIIYAFTSRTDDGTKQTYGTTVYSLTPAS